MYNRYKIPKKKKSLKQICYPKEYKLQLPQQFLAKFMQNNKSVLVFHRIGAGKTCSAVNICEKWKGRKKIIVVVPASLRVNFRDELRTPCAKNNYLTDKERKLLQVLHPTSDEYKKIIKLSNKRIDKYYKIYSYNKFVKDKPSLNNCLLVIDEVQNIVSNKGSNYKIIYKMIEKAKGVKTVLLSATPIFDKPIEIALTMNLIITDKFDINNFNEKYIDNNKFINQDEFKNKIRGYISYYKGAPDHVFPEMKLKYDKCEMSNFQYRSYMTVLKDDLRMFKYAGIKKMPNDFDIGTRMISNISYPNKHMNQKGYESFVGSTLGSKLGKYSTKFYKIINRINRVSGTVLVYSNFKKYGGLKAFQKVLDYNGYKNYVNFGEGRKRYAIWSGDENDKIKGEIKDIFNQFSNKTGKKLKIVLLSPSAKEGISFKRVQQMHILEPYWNQSRIDQIIGRAVRYCSHKDIKENKQKVKVYIYLAVYKKEYTIDKIIVKLAKRKNKLIKQFEKVMKENSVDCHLNKYANESWIKCE